MTEEQHTAVAHAFDVLKQALHADASYAHSWHCNLAMCAYDAIGEALPHAVKHALVQDAATRFMKLCFDIETSNDMLGGRGGG